MIITSVDLATAIARAHGNCSVQQLREARRYLRAGAIPPEHINFMLPILRELQTLQEERQS